MTADRLSGYDIKLIRSDFLPGRTMVVSPDLYDLLANDGEAAKKQQAETMTQIAAFTELMRNAKP
jgi:hypothetical protein